MATAADLIERSMRVLGQLNSGSTPTDDEYADGLEALNAMLASWNNPRQMCYALQEESLTLADGDASYTIGPSGDLTTTRPVEIIQAWIVESNVSYDVRLISDEQYAAIPDKTTEADWPEFANYKATMANGTLTVWPLPNATRTLKLQTRIALSAFTSTDTTVNLPPGWEDALVFNLAVRWAPEFQTMPSPDVKEMARETKAEIKRINHKPIVSTSELPALVNRRVSNITTDTP